MMLQPNPIGHFGKKRGVATVGGLTLTDTSYAAGFSTPWHVHERAALCLVINGDYLERFRQTALECRTGTVVFRPAGSVHSDAVGREGARCLIVEPSFQWMHMYAPWLRTETPTLIISTRAAAYLGRAVLELRRPDDVTPLAVEGLVCAAVADAARSARRRQGRIPHWLVRVRSALEDHFRDRVTLADLAAIAGVHPVHLASTFQRAYGMSVGEYLRRCRVEAGRAALRDRRRTIGEIALASGFSGHSHFSRVFAKHFGISPRAYRREHLP